MGLTVQQRQLKAFKISASMLPTLMHGDEAAILRLYCEEIGEAEREPPNYAMQLGSFIEPFLLDYQQQKTGHAITRRGEVVDHPTVPEFCCTLDGYRAHDDAVVETKFLAPWRNKEEFAMYYYPQVIAQMRCTGAARGVLLAGQGTAEPVEYDITPKPDDERAAAYEAAIWERVSQFRHCLRTFTPPFPMPKVITPEIWRTIDLTKEPLPNWGHAMLPTLELYEDTREAAEIHEQAGKDARSLVPDDVSVVLAHNHKLSRDVRGKLSIRRVHA
jgi:YqaJ-like recombinase protein